MKSPRLENIELPTTIDYCANFDRETKEFISAVVVANVYEKNGQIYCNLELGNGYLFADYDGENNEGCMWISDVLSLWAKENFGKLAYWDWENPGLLSLTL